MKKIIAVLLTAGIVTTALCGCGIRKEADKKPLETTAVETTVAEETTMAVAESKFEFGVVNNQVYENPFIGIGCTLDENWTYYDDEQIKELNNIATDLAGEEYENFMSNASVIYDMYAVNSDSVTNINVTAEKVDPTVLEILDLKQNYEMVASVVVSSLDNTGYTDVKYEIIDTEIDGQSVPAIKNTGKLEDENLYQLGFSLKCDGYLASITVTAFDEDVLNEILSKFYFV